MIRPAFGRSASRGANVGKITVVFRLWRQPFILVRIEGSVWRLQVRKTEEEGTKFPPDLLIDLLGPAVSIRESSRAGRHVQ